MDDTNPTKEDQEYVESIKQDVKWLGYDWGDKLFSPPIITRNFMIARWS